MIAVWESDISDTFLIPRLNCPTEATLFKSWGKLFHKQPRYNKSFVSSNNSIWLGQRKEKVILYGWLQTRNSINSLALSLQAYALAP